MRIGDKVTQKYRLPALPFNYPGRVFEVLKTTSDGMVRVQPVDDGISHGPVWLPAIHLSQVL